jgi:hypothetical protein
MILLAVIAYLETTFMLAHVFLKHSYDHSAEKRAAKLG